MRLVTLARHSALYHVKNDQYHSSHLTKRLSTWCAGARLRTGSRSRAALRRWRRSTCSMRSLGLENGSLRQRARISTRLIACSSTSTRRSGSPLVRRQPQTSCKDSNPEALRTYLHGVCALPSLAFLVSSVSLAFCALYVRTLAMY